jgi:hypothetical protein
VTTEKLTKEQSLTITSRLVGIVNRLFAGGTQYGVDWPTLYACYPAKAQVLRRLAAARRANHHNPRSESCES